MALGQGKYQQSPSAKRSRQALINATKFSKELGCNKQQGAYKES